MKVERGLFAVAVLLAVMAFVGVVFGGCWATVLVYRWNVVAGWATGILAVLVFFFVLGALATDEDF